MKGFSQIAQHFFAQQLISLTRATKQKFLLAVDIVVAALAWALVVPRLDGQELVQGVVFCVVVIAIGYRLGLYRAVLRFAGVRVLWVICLSYAVASLGAAAWRLITGELLLPSSYLNLAIFGTALAAGARIAVREVLFQSSNPIKTAVVIYGAGDSGRQLLTAIMQSHTMLAVAMVDDDKGLEGAEFHGTRVYPPSALEGLCLRHQVQTVILALPNLSRSRRANILQALEGLPVQVRSIPRITDILAGRRDLLDLEAISVEELLGRDPVMPLGPLMRQTVWQRVVCVTGAGGSIGSELVRQLLKLRPKKLVLVETSEFALYEIHGSIEAEARRNDVELVPVLQSVTDPKAMTALLSTQRVQLLFHAAAYKHVPLVELNPFAGVFNNVFGTKAILDAAIEANLQAVVLISTDKAVRPTNIMGASKRIAELIVQAYSARQLGSAKEPVMSIVRFGNVLSSSGSVIPRFQRQIRQGGPLTVTHPEITRYFMTIPEAVELVIQTGGMSKPGDVFLLDMGEPVKILDLAIRMIRLSGLKPLLPDSLPSYQLNDRLGVFDKSGRERTRSQPEADSTPRLQTVPIVFTGLRPGEKLYEELLIDSKDEKTEHPMIRRASERFIPLGELAPLIEGLREACQQGDQHALEAMLERFDIGYHKQSEDDSAYQALDARRGEALRSASGGAFVEAHFSGSDDRTGNAQPPDTSIRKNTVAPTGVSELGVAEKASIHPFLSKSLHLFFLLTRPLTLGARGIVLNNEREVLLVRHRYEQGWQLPGGGVEIGESPIDTLRREVLEETGVELVSEPQLLGSYFNRGVSDRDHVLVYRCEESRQGSLERLSGEIAASGFFPIDKLPQDTTPGTKRRLAECFEGLAVQEHW